MKKILDCIYRISDRLASVGSGRYLHMFAGLVVSMVVCKGLHAAGAPLVLSLLPAFLVMAGKESADYFYRKKQFDWKAVAAGMVGAVVGLILSAL